MQNADRIKHLYARAGFGLTPEEWLAKKDMPVNEALQTLLSPSSPGDLPAGLITQAGDISMEEAQQMSPEEKEARLEKERQLVFELNAKWIARMADPASSPLLEKTALFWHGHFACISRFGLLASGQLQTLRTHALGNFRDLTLAIARDASMIRFLNNQQNKKEQPNENFARELMELFTIGRGHYTEHDVKEAARAFTGWSSNLRGEFVFRKFQHDFGQKSFMGKTGDFDGTDIIDLLLERRETAQFIAAKAYRFFVADEADAGTVQWLGDVFYDSGYEISALLNAIFTSDWFYEPAVMGVRIKSPVELIAGMLRQTRGRINDRLGLLAVERALGQILFHPPNVAGWPGGKKWIDHPTLLLRLNLAGMLFKAAQLDIRLREQPEEARPGRLQQLDATVDLSAYSRWGKNLTARELAGQLADYLLPYGADAHLDTVLSFTDQKNQETTAATLLYRLMSLPEYQLC
ncbi:MAG: DUF1800 domain-containing protein [Saprospiraceae bacterium]